MLLGDVVRGLDHGGGSLSHTHSLVMPDLKHARFCARPAGEADGVAALYARHEHCLTGESPE